MVSHGNLLHNEIQLRAAFGTSEDSLVVGWLPLYHDMGLIGNVLNPLCVGFPCYLMAPVAFLQKPQRWLQAISKYRATISGGPNFAYDLCVRKTTEQQREELDLSSWNLAFNGAEPVNPNTLQRFVNAFWPFGLLPNEFQTLLRPRRSYPFRLVRRSICPCASRACQSLRTRTKSSGAGQRKRR